MQAKRVIHPSMLSFPFTRTDRSIQPRFALNRSGDDLYFINHDVEVLPWVKCSSGGAAWGDDGSSTNMAGPEMAYQDVQPGEAVLIDRFDPMLDGDFLIQDWLLVHSPTLGHLLFNIIQKGGPGSKVLVWSDSFDARYVNMFELTEEAAAYWPSIKNIFQKG